MSGDSEHESGSAGDMPMPNSADEAGAEPVYHPRPFRSWASAYQEEESEPSVWVRMRDRIAGLFSRRKSDAAEDVSDDMAVADVPVSLEDQSIAASEPPVVDDDQGVEWVDLGESAAPEPEISASAEAPADASSDEPLAVAPPDDFKFPWTRPDEGGPAPTPEPKGPGFFARLFGRKPKEEMPVEAAADDMVVASEMAAEEVVVDEAQTVAPFEDEEIIRTNEYPVEEPFTARVEETFESVEEALPAAEEPPAEESFPGMDAVAPAEPKRGFFARLFGKREKPAPRPSLEIEIHEDRIEAAANALDEVGEQTFAEAQEEPAAVPDAFASVAEALPADDTPPADLRFAPPPSDARDTRDTREVVQESRDTLELVKESRDTLEVTQPSRDTLEVVPDFGDTLEVIPAPTESGETIEIAEKTDEFAVPVGSEGPTKDVDEDTAEVGKKSFLARLLFWRKTDKVQVADAGVAVVEGNPVFLFAKFRAFYNEIIRFKHQKSEFTAGFSTAIVTDYAADLSPDSAAEGLSKKLTEMLELQAAESRWMGGEAAERYPDAQYAMAALADEVFTHMEWEGQPAWPKHLLEVKLYRTRAADVELFRRIDKLLKEQPNSPVARDMARVYLLVIAAGFKGKYRPFGLTRALAEYRQRLFEYIHSGDALLLYAPERKIFPDAAARTLEGHAVSRFTAAQRWAAILIFLVVGYTVLAHVAWNSVSADLKDVTERIKSGNTTTGAR